MAPASPLENLRVTVVGDHAQTIEGPRRYLSAAGVETYATRSLSDGMSNPVMTDALVIFLDEFRKEEVLETILALQKGQPELKLLLIRSSPQHYQASRLMDAALPPILLAETAIGVVDLGCNSRAVLVGRTIALTIGHCSLTGRHPSEPAWSPDHAFE